MVSGKLSTMTDFETIITKLKKFECPLCPRDFARRVYYVRHLLKVHNGGIDISPEDREFVNKKKISGKRFSKNNFWVHIRRHTGENLYKCIVCFKSFFTRRQDMNVHFRQHTGGQPDVCLVCGKSSCRNNKFTRHMRVHTEERPYKCSKCPRTFTQSNDFKIHLRRHTGERSLISVECARKHLFGSSH